MSTIDEAEIRRIVADVVRRLPEARPSEAPKALVGVFKTLDDAVEAARRAHRAVVERPLEARKEAIARIRRAIADGALELSRMSVEETGFGRVDDKVAKNLLAAYKTPGVEHLVTQAHSGDHGLSIEERAPYGVIGSITPCTNPTETLVNNGIGMLAGGNAVVFSVHPLAARTSAACIDRMNRAVMAAGLPENVFTCVETPSIEVAQALMVHPGVNLLVVTGGGPVVKAAMRSGRKTIGAGPGNPPVVVDATADVTQAGTGIVRGASFDNNVICTCEKEVFVVDAVGDGVMRAMEAAGGVRLSGRDLDALVKLLFPDGKTLDRKPVGKSASWFLERIGRPVQGDPRLIFAEVGEDHPFVQHELLMPVLGVVRCRSVDEAIDAAIRTEHGNRHTASMYSKDLDALHRMARAFDGSLFVKNAPNYAGLGFGGEGFTSWTIASPTGEGLTTCRDFTRFRRCTLAGYFRIV